MSGTKETHRKRRQELRRKLKEQGVPANEIEQIIARKREEQRAARAGARHGAAQLEEWERETYARLSLDDRGYRPSRPDAVTTGQGRATGPAAKAVKRGKTLTRWEYDQASGGSVTAETKSRRDA